MSSLHASCSSTYVLVLQEDWVQHVSNALPAWQPADVYHARVMFMHGAGRQVLEDYVEARRVAGNIHQIIAGGWSNYYGANAP